MAHQPETYTPMADLIRSTLRFELSRRGSWSAERLAEELRAACKDDSITAGTIRGIVRKDAGTAIPIDRGLYLMAILKVRAKRVLDAHDAMIAQIEKSTTKGSHG